MTPIAHYALLSEIQSRINDYAKDLPEDIKKRCGGELRVEVSYDPYKIAYVIVVCWDFDNRRFKCSKLICAFQSENLNCNKLAKQLYSSMRRGTRKYL